MGTASQADGTASVLFGKVRTSVLAILFCHSDRAFHTRQILSVAGVGHGAVQRELSALVQAGLVVSRRQGNQVLYQANAESPIFPELRSLMVKTAGVADVLRAALAPLAERIRLAFIYGSFAKGSHTSASDVDIMIVGEVSTKDVVSVLRDARDKLRREINPSVFSAEEFRNRMTHEDHFITSVLGEPRIFLMGDEDELGRLAQA